MFMGCGGSKGKKADAVLVASSISEKAPPVAVVAAKAAVVAAPISEAAPARVPTVRSPTLKLDEDSVRAPGAATLDKDADDLEPESSPKVKSRPSSRIDAPSAKSQTGDGPRSAPSARLPRPLNGLEDDQRDGTARRPSQVVDQQAKGFFDFSALPERPQDGGQAEPITLKDALPAFDVVDHVADDPWASLQTQYKPDAARKPGSATDAMGGERPDMESAGSGPNSRGAGGRKTAPQAGAAAAGDLVLDDEGGGAHAVAQGNLSARQQRNGAPAPRAGGGGGGGWDQGNMAKAGTIMVDDADLDLDSYGATHSSNNHAQPPMAARIEDRSPPPQKFNNQAKNNVGELGLEDVEDVESLMADEMAHA